MSRQASHYYRSQGSQQLSKIDHYFSPILEFYLTPVRMVKLYVCVCVCVCMCVYKMQQDQNGFIPGMVKVKHTNQ